MSKEMHKSI